MRNQTKTIFLLSVWLFAFAGVFGNAQDESKGADSQNLIYSLKGADLFRAYCASCHGLSGRGDGPAAGALKARVPDLTTIAKKSGGRFPAGFVREFITGDKVVLSHGTREMPIWGPIFHVVEEDRDFGNVRLENVVKYLQSIQSDTTSSPLSGAELYRQ